MLEFYFKPNRFNSPKIVALDFCSLEFKFIKIYANCIIHNHKNMQQNCAKKLINAPLCVLKIKKCMICAVEHLFKTAGFGLYFAKNARLEVCNYLDLIK